jgi:hypothetical protein
VLIVVASAGAAVGVAGAVTRRPLRFRRL